MISCLADSLQCLTVRFKANAATLNMHIKLNAFSMVDLSFLLRFSVGLHKGAMKLHEACAMGLVKEVEEVLQKVIKDQLV